MPSMIAVSDLKACAQVMKLDVPEAWSPGPSGLAFSLLSPVTTEKSALMSARLASMGGSA